MRLVPGIDADDACEVTRVEMIDERGFAFGLEVKAVLAAIGFEGGGDGFEFGAGAGGLLGVQGAHQRVEIFPTSVAGSDLGNAPLATIAFDETKGGFDLRGYDCRVAHRVDILDAHGVGRELDSGHAGDQAARFFGREIAGGERAAGDKTNTRGYRD